MKKLACLCAVVGLSSVSFGFVNLNLNNPYQTTGLPGLGSIFLTFSGTVDILHPAFAINGATLESPDNGSQILNTALDAGFQAYLSAAAPGVDYTGDIFTVEIQSTNQVGNYWFGGGGLSAFAELIVTASAQGLPDAVDNELYGVTVVPEPATLAALGLGAAALLRRRRKV